MNRREIYFPLWGLTVSPIQWCGFHRAVPSHGFIPRIGAVCMDCVKAFAHLGRSRLVSPTVEAAA